MQGTIAAADGLWPSLLSQLCGLPVDTYSGHHQPCPNCGCTDRFRWDDDSGPGSWYCNCCGGKDGRGGGGTGIGLLMRLRDLSFRDAATLVERHLGVSAPGTDHNPPTQQPHPLPRPARARSGKPARTPETPPPGAAPPPLDRGAVSQWLYTDADGQQLFWIQRINLSSGSKAFLHRVWLDGSWHRPAKTDPFTCHWPAPRPLYNLAQLAADSDAPVLLVEGESAADAAADLFPDYVVCTWANGAKAIGQTDWQPLAGRAVTLWPDADTEGAEAMAKVAGLLLQLGATVQHVAPPGTTSADWDHADAPGAKGWDLADATWTPQQAAAWLAGNSKPVHLPPAPPLLQAPPQPPPHDEPPPAPRPHPSAPFRLLGYDQDAFYYQPHSTGQVVRLARGSHTGTNLVALAPLEYWESCYPNKMGANWTSAASDLFRRQAAAGMFNPDTLRGRGAWWDRGRSVLHLGGRLVVDGEAQPLTGDLQTNFHYQRAVALHGPGDAEPLSDDEALLTITMANRFRWDVEASGLLLAGWTCLAPICGVLQWRPHIWLTATASSGKSTILERYVVPLLGDMSLVIVGSSTEAGIRQSLRADALPVILDEAESNERADELRIQNILGLARGSSSDFRGATMKGSANHEAEKFRVRSMFMFSSIATALKRGADKRRFAELQLRPPGADAKADRMRDWESLDKDLDRYITDEYAQWLLARTVRLIPMIRQAVAVLTKAAAAHFDSQGMGDQYGTLLAGAWALQSSRVPTPEEAACMIAGANWQSYQEATEQADEDSCLQRLMQHQLRVESGDGMTYTRTINELVQLAGGHGLNQLEPLSPRAAADTLGRHGIRLDGAYVLVSNTAEGVARILRDTPWASSWGAQMARLPGAVRRGPTHFSGLGTSRCCAVPVRLLD